MHQVLEPVAILETTVTIVLCTAVDSAVGPGATTLRLRLDPARHDVVFPPQLCFPGCDASMSTITVHDFRDAPLPTKQSRNRCDGMPHGVESGVLRSNGRPTFHGPSSDYVQAPSETLCIGQTSP